MMNAKKFKCIALVLVLIVALISLCGCNMSVVDTTWKFDRAIVRLADDRVIDGHVQSWLEFDGSDMLQVKIDDVVYLTHSSNIVLMAE